jgi:photosystem II stability/assembly factor-like uncharacterized protein
MPAFVASALVLIASAAHGAAIRDNLYGVKAMSAAEAWAVGNFGSIYHTTDAGKTWDSRESGTRSPLFSVDFADAKSGWVVGRTAIILHTTDGGVTWKPQKAAVPTEKHLFKVKVVDTQTVWAVGDFGAMTVTHDGKTWEDRSLTEDVVLYDISFPDAQHGFVCGEFGTVLATSDGGLTWQKQSAGTDKTLFGLVFTTAQNGWAVGIDGLIVRTRDGGQSWTVQRGSPGHEAIEDLGFLEALRNPGLYEISMTGKNGIVVGDTGVLLVSGDGGETWTRRELPAKDRLVWMRDVSLAPDSQGFAVGASGFSARVEGERVILPTGGEATAFATP